MLGSFAALYSYAIRFQSPAYHADIVRHLQIFFNHQGSKEASIKDVKAQVVAPTGLSSSISVELHSGESSLPLT